ncbi:TauD/TfdA family dioxygenase [Streptomyces olindensis]|uniref:TauD/TfdA family dioxygenase n=1 Tax=Streptomyces olindensis TaxID=358823 RepID=UPI0036C81A14
MRDALTRPATLFASHYIDIRAPHAACSVAAQLQDTGLVTVDGLTSRATVLGFATGLMRITPHPHGDPDGLTAIHDTGVHAHRAGFAGLGHGDLEAHTERSGVPNPPRLMLLVCLRPAAEGGDVLVADGHDVLASLSADSREAPVMLSKPRTAYFGAGAGHPTQVFTVHADGRVSVRLRQDGLARWSPVVHSYLPSLRRAVAGCQRRLRLQPGQGYLVDNHRWLHARTRFSGNRLCLRALGEPRTPMPEGFAPDSVGICLPKTNETV